MGEVRFMISEAAKQVHVESHVLRYWEEELELVIGRTEMGHRYYTEDDIQLFCCIKKLKDAGMLLKDLKPLIPELKSTKLKLQKTEALKKCSSEKRNDCPDCVSSRCGFCSGGCVNSSSHLRSRSRAGHSTGTGPFSDRRCIDRGRRVQQ